jgi:rhomboid protease GluP
MRSRLTLTFSILLLVIYGLSSFPSDFRHIAGPVAFWGSFYPPAVFGGEWWRFFTAALLHANPGHLLNNLFGILVFGSLLEPLIGPLRLLGLFLASNLTGLLFSAFFLPKVPTLGASTLDFGLIGAYFTLVLIQGYRTNRRVFAGQLRSALVFVLLFVVWNALELATVNLWGHLGGFFAGTLFALAVMNRPRRPEAENGKKVDISHC